MSTSTHGLRLRSGSHAWRAAVELLSSMRFAIALLSVICIASVIGTVLQQQQPQANYVNQFGPFWAQLFGALQLDAVYSAWWFLLILAFLVTSTSLCIARSTPKILADLRIYKEGLRVQALRAFAHRAEGTAAGTPAEAAQRIGAALVQRGWKVRLQERPAGAGAGWMVAAKAGAANKLGYIAAHSAIVLVCVGGLLDGDLVVRAQMAWGGKQPYFGGGMVADVPDAHRLGSGNPTFRGNILVAEGTQSSTAVLNQGGGVVLQELPFSIELKRFVVEHYSTGMPRKFASDIVIHDKAGGAPPREARVEVNHPVRHAGVEIYQSSFDDGGSPVRLEGLPVAGGERLPVASVVGTSTPLPDGRTLEPTALRVINVENLSSAGKAGGGGTTDVRAVDLRSSLEARLGAANKAGGNKDLRNVGPSITYKLRDAAGQAREFHNYMLPVDTGDGTPVFLFGLRETPAEPFRYLRVPADGQSSPDSFLRLAAAVQESVAREAAVRRYAARAADASRPDMQQQLAQSAGRALDLFARGGLQAVAEFLEQNVPEAERARAGEVLVRILNGVLFELAQSTRDAAGEAPLGTDDAAQAFMTQAVLSLSDLQLYPAPAVFVLRDFTQRQASVFQVARAPGKWIVYLGCTLLILGIFAMLYVRERRLWVWLAAADATGAASRATMALSSNRRLLDVDREFERLRAELLTPPP